MGERSAALVTGAASGIGRAIALRLGGMGLHVLCCDLERSPDGASEPPTDEAIAQGGGSAEFVACDVCGEDDLEGVGELIRASGRPLWAAAINAGICPGAYSILDEDLDAHRRVMEVNEEGAWLTCRLAGRVMVEQEVPGRIVFTASVDGLVGEPESGSYCSSKGAVVNLTRAVALDLAPYGITVNAVCPGWVQTPLAAPQLSDPEFREGILGMHPLGRFGTPDDIAAAVGFLVSDDAAWITGVPLPVDGGFTCR
jgi:NAD(P)-dependent dehydrogenase (short-subunit alcohol dehydrogenase family)